MGGDPLSGASASALLLDADAAWRCPVATHNWFDPAVSRPARDGSAGAAEASPLAEAPATTPGPEDLLERLGQWPGAVDLRGLAGDEEAAQVAATVAAVDRMAPVIVWPRLPHDMAGHRSGSPDALVLAGGPGGHASGYRPVLLVRHRVLQKSEHGDGPDAQLVGEGAAHIAVVGAVVRMSRERDLLRLAHHWRMLESLGWQAGGRPSGGLIGTDRVVPAPASGGQERPAGVGGAAAWTPVSGSPEGFASGGRALITWCALDAPVLRVFARTARSGWRRFSALERYDHEFEFRLHVARVALGRHGGGTGPEPAVRPVVVDECEGCPWWPVCRPRFDENDLSLHIDKARLDAREVSLLRAMGIQTIQQLASADIEALLPDYLPQVAHRAGGEKRLRVAARRARLLARGETLERTRPGAIELPPDGWSIDLDIETSVRDRVYLWGFLVSDPQDSAGSHYVHFSRFAVLDEAAERALAEEAMTWLVAQLEAHPEGRVYHYSDFEVVHIRRIAASGGLPQTVRAANRLTRTAFFDLFPVVRSNFFGAHGLGLKALAQSGAGFRWRDEEPGGLNSQRWFARAVGSADAVEKAALRRRVLEYNEDDTRATLALREWLRTLR
ncbi:RecB family nuclease, putative, TM0106 family [Propionibacterium cyclohexanicum]|uniref:RecB family nuclease, putative, TM0106 family n=1 Tax=Propionibacterium cyclohexanicum TaxID=64702 RepID=A0A1H9T955_9ACTN|nr:TM0106 family RecB-like putative nuclease [Propionibacterium cyclohexanicum]SER93800.1 RecB family nuclease, putative, TM0106 family [Propionibacterium cyclohexanicum]